MTRQLEGRRDCGDQDEDIVVVNILDDVLLLGDKAARPHFQVSHDSSSRY